MRLKDYADAVSARLARRLDEITEDPEAPAYQQRHALEFAMRVVSEECRDDDGEDG